MLARADMALYNAKRAGRNCTRVLMASIDGGNPTRIDLVDSAIIR
jgi:predicted signal transduction protein with EAL and GGDEF domain